MDQGTEQLGTTPCVIYYSITCLMLIIMCRYTHHTCIY